MEDDLMKSKTNPWCFVLHINADADLDEAWQILQAAGLTPLYMEEDPGQLVKMYVQASSEQSTEGLLKRFPFIQYAEYEELGDINWEEQWKLHGFNFHDGYVHIDVPEAITADWKQIKLLPGGGFGDMSHPSTRLVLKMMQNVVKGKTVFDIGCGSGVLALVAVALGAQEVFAIDIDGQALDHSKENADLNGMNGKIHFYLTPEFSKVLDPNEKSVILMNMVISEQMEAWSSLKTLHSMKGISLTSGILSEQKEEYLKLVKSWGWKLEEELEEDGWLALKFLTGKS